VIRAALADAAARLGVSLSPSVVELERPRDPAHGDVATNLALTARQVAQAKARAVAERLVATLQLHRVWSAKIRDRGPGSSTSSWLKPARERPPGGAAAGDRMAAATWGRVGL